MGMADPESVPRETPIAHSSCCPHCEPHMALMRDLIASIDTLAKVMRQSIIEHSAEFGDLKHVLRAVKK